MPGLQTRSQKMCCMWERLCFCFRKKQTKKKNYGLLQNYKRSDLTKRELLRIVAADMSEKVQKDYSIGHGGTVLLHGNMDPQIG